MGPWLTNLDFEHLAWLSVIAYALHYAEEGPRLVRWFHDHHPMRGLQYTQRKLNIENALLFGATLAAVLALNLYPDSWVLQALVLSTAFGYAGNAFFHILPTLRTGIYSPGVVTASAIFPFVAPLYMWKASQLGILSARVLGLASVVGALALPISIFLTHKWLVREPRSV